MIFCENCGKDIIETDETVNKSPLQAKRGIQKRLNFHSNYNRTIEMDCKTREACSFKYNPSKHLTHKLTKMHIA